MTLYLESRIELACEYDAENDVLHAWVGDKPRPAISNESIIYESDDGHLIRLDPETKEFVGVTIFDFQARWAEQPICLE